MVVVVVIVIKSVCTFTVCTPARSDFTQLAFIFIVVVVIHYHIQYLRVLGSLDLFAQSNIYTFSFFFFFCTYLCFNVFQILELLALSKHRKTLVCSFRTLFVDFDSYRSRSSFDHSHPLPCQVFATRPSAALGQPHGECLF